LDIPCGQLGEETEAFLLEPEAESQGLPGAPDPRSSLTRYPREQDQELFEEEEEEEQDARPEEITTKGSHKDSSKSKGRG